MKKKKMECINQEPYGSLSLIGRLDLDPIVLRN
jgi:hypothetical protein